MRLLKMFEGPFKGFLKTFRRGEVEDRINGKKMTWKPRRRTMKGLFKVSESPLKDLSNGRDHLERATVFRVP